MGGLDPIAVILFGAMVILIMLVQDPSLICTPKWECSDWSSCVLDYKTRLCEDGCGTTRFEEVTCEEPNTPPIVECSDWTLCDGIKRTRICTDDCGSTATIEQDCQAIGEGYLVIADYKFQDELAPLMSFRSTQFNVYEYYVDNPSVAEIQNIINQNAQDIKYIFLVGSTSLIPTDGSSDNNIADTDDNLYPEYAVGRLAFSTEQQVSNYVAKVLEYEQQEQYKDREIIFVGASESEEVINSWQTCNAFEAEIYPILGLPYEEICCYCENTADACTGHDSLVINKVNEGVSYLVFKGHGSEWVWYIGCPAAISATDIDEFHNDQYPVAITMSCATINLGGEDSIPLRYLSAVDKGFVAIIGSIEETGNFGDWGQQLFINLQAEETLGVAFLKAKYSAEPHLIYNQHILGDPGLTIN